MTPMAATQSPVPPAGPTDPIVGALRGRTVLAVIVGHLASAPRAQKEARALRSAGAEVIIRGNWFDPSLVDEDREIAAALDVDFAPATDLRRTGGNMIDLWRHRFARGAGRLGVRSPRMLGPGAPELLRAARRIGADLTVVHSEPGLWVGRALLADGRRVAVDFEDWFSRDQLPEDRTPSVRAALEDLERHLLANAHACLATTRVMAEALAEHGGTTRVPAVVRNCFPAPAGPPDMSGDMDVVEEGAVSFYWFSQTIGPGRGLEALAQALPRLRGDWRLTLRGALGHHRAWFEDTFPPAVRARIRCVAPVSNADLPARTRSHDVGLALELPYCLNKELTASNKLHEYLRAGLAVIATDTRGQAEVMRASRGAGVLVEPGDSAALAGAMQRMLDDPAHRMACRLNAAHAGATTWDWAHQEQALLQALAGAFA